MKHLKLCRLSYKVNDPADTRCTCVPRAPKPSTSTPRGKKKDKKKVYETLHLASQGHPINVTVPPREEENPYSVICHE